MHSDFINIYAMKKILLFVALFCGIASYAQDYTQHNKGKIFVFWGGNRISSSLRLCFLEDGFFAYKN